MTEAGWVRQILGMCGLVAWCRAGGQQAGLPRRRSGGSIVVEQSRSVVRVLLPVLSCTVLQVRGDHPIAFVLPSVSLSEAGSETDQSEVT